MAFGPHLLLAVLEGLVSSAVLALTALGLSLVFGVMRVVNIAHGEFYMLGAVLAWAVATTVGGPPALGFLAALVLAPLAVGAVLAWAVATTVGGPPALGFLAALVLAPLAVGAVALVSDRLVLRRLHYEPQATIVATIGLLYIIQQLTLTFYGPDAHPVPPP